MTTNFIIAIVLFIMSSFFIGVTEAIWLAGLYLGFAFLAVGILMMSSRPFRERYYREYMHDPEGDKLLSEKERNFFDRYYFPFNGIVGGIIMIFAYWLTHQELLASIWNRLAQLF